ncbi:PREDICTED: putative IQ motif and ankyrin repeat domain-containing protein [Branchiostoma belcheri]|uniref:IQ motif and ankyrin repeat domain-containing protein n=1 Tax=Branchiostoma belcheri TaxID=7741 RepID=A0A6P4Y408_BRABE|nr:PREDICTED: putative IQ motif and ankyrin repeat domain-containing protein [Branchiostoma belcheri]
MPPKPVAAKAKPKPKSTPQPAPGARPGGLRRHGAAPPAKARAPAVTTTKDKPAAEKPKELEIPEVKIELKQLVDVLINDTGGKIKDSGKWPLVIDESDRVSTFLRYQDTNYLNAKNPGDMEPERIRMAIIGGIRFGKPVVLDMMDTNMFHAAADKFDVVQKGLLESVMTKDILVDQKYVSLVKDSDPDEYTDQSSAFRHGMVDGFRFFLITNMASPPLELMQRTYVIRVQ